MPHLVHEFSELFHKYEEKRSKDIDEKVIHQFYYYFASLDPENLHNHEIKWNNLQKQLGGYLQQYRKIELLFISCLTGKKLNLSIFPDKNDLHPGDTYYQEAFNVLNNINQWKNKVQGNIWEEITNTSTEKIFWVIEKQIQNQLDWHIIKYISEKSQKWLYLSKFLNQSLITNLNETIFFSDIKNLRINLSKALNEWDSLFKSGVVIKNIVFTCQNILELFSNAKNDINSFRNTYSSAKFVDKAYFQSDLIQNQIKRLDKEIENYIKKFSELQSILQKQFKNYDNRLPALRNICELLKEISKKPSEQSQLIFALPNNFSKLENDASNGIKSENIYSISMDNPFRSWLMNKSEKITPPISRNTYLIITTILITTIFILAILMFINFDLFDKIFPTKTKTIEPQVISNFEDYHNWKEDANNPQQPENQTSTPTLILTSDSENNEFCKEFQQDYLNGNVDYKEYEKDLFNLPQCDFSFGISTLQMVRDAHLSELLSSTRFNERRFRDLIKFHSIYLSDLNIPREISKILDDRYLYDHEKVSDYIQWLSETNKLCSLNDETFSASRRIEFTEILDDHFNSYIEENNGSLVFERFCRYDKNILYEKLDQEVTNESNQNGLNNLLLLSVNL